MAIHELEGKERVVALLEAIQEDADLALSRLDKETDTVSTSEAIDCSMGMVFIQLFCRDIERIVKPVLEEAQKKWDEEDANENLHNSS